MICVENVSLTYNQTNARVEALSDVSFDLDRGSSISLIGPSGCGKSSLLFILAGLIKPTSGKVFINGVESTGRFQDAALILQDYGLFPWKTVFENACLGLQVRGLGKKEQGEVVMPILDKLGLAEFMDHYPAQLSGGQKQRVAIGRSLALKPKLLLMDEPLSSLDALTRETLQQFILDIWKEHDLTLVLVTHSIGEAVFLGNRIAVMTGRPGSILEVIDNPSVGSPGFRQQPEFHRLSSRLRQLLGVEA
ncbi:MAG: ABC transporter ATP-binding protein [Eubacteriales bacterium]